MDPTTIAAILSAYAQRPQNDFPSEMPPMAPNQWPPAQPNQSAPSPPGRAYSPTPLTEAQMGQLLQWPVGRGVEEWEKPPSTRPPVDEAWGLPNPQADDIRRLFGRRQQQNAPLPNPISGKSLADIIRGGHLFGGDNI
jgi:hypothetical protein